MAEVDRGALSSRFVPFEDPTSAALLPNGGYVICCMLNRKIFAVSPDGRHSCVIAKKRVAKSPISVAVCKNGDIIFCDFEKLRIGRMSPGVLGPVEDEGLGFEDEDDGEKERSVVILAKDIQPTSVTELSDGSIVFSETFLGRVTWLPLEGPPVVLLEDEASKPCGVAAYGDDQVVICDRHFLKFVDYRTGALLREVAGPDEEHLFLDVAVVENDKIIVCAEDQLSIFSYEGVFQANIGSSGDQLLQFNKPASVMVRGDEVVVCEQNNSRLQVISGLISSSMTKSAAR